MAFFGLTDVKFNQESPRVGPLSALEGSSYESTTLRYPQDVGSVNKGHYMIFFVREQTNTAFKAGDRGYRDFATNQQDLFDSFSNRDLFSGGGLTAGRETFADKINGALTGAVSRGTSFLSQKGGKIGGKVSGAIDGFVKGPQPQEQLNDQKSTSIEQSVKSITDKNSSTTLGGKLLKRTRLTSDAIALYMPDTLNFDSEANYDELRPGEEVLGQLLAAAPTMVEFVKNKDYRGLLNAARKSGLASIVGQQLAAAAGIGPGVSRLGTFAATGGIVNPMLELIYSSPRLRDFQFEFMFYPRSEAEAFEVQKIIDRFRFHQAPELEGGLGSQTGLIIPPSEFDIRFYYGGRENPNIPPIATCVLRSVQVNFAPRGFSAYESIGENSPALGRTGMPVAITMTLRFQETTFVTKEDFNKQLTIERPVSGKSGEYAGITEGVAFGKMR
jgi:hypothetical protein